MQLCNACSTCFSYWKVVILSLETFQTNNDWLWIPTQKAIKMSLVMNVRQANIWKILKETKQEWIFNEKPLLLATRKKVFCKWNKVDP